MLLGGLVLLSAFALVSQAEGCVQPLAGLVSWWQGDGTAEDLVGGNDGILVGGATFDQGLVGKAFLLNGRGAFVNLGNSPSLHVSRGEFTVDAWVNFNSLGDCLSGPGCDMSIVDRMSTSSTGTTNSDGWRLLKQEDNHFWFCLGGGSVNGCVLGAPTTVRSDSMLVAGVDDKPGQWHHVAAVKTSSTISIYVDGNLEATTQLGGFTATDSSDLLIGSAERARAFLDGLLDEGEIYNRAFTPEEIFDIFNAGAADKCNVAIDIEPGSSPNRIDRGSQPSIPVAILSSAGFNASEEVDIASLRFGTTGNEVSLSAASCSLEYVNGDTLPDLVCHFDTQLAEFQAGDARGFLKGQTRSGTPIRGTDSVLIVPIVPTHEETKTGVSTAARTVQALGLTEVGGQLYLAAVATKPAAEVKEISGLDLVWKPVMAQCSGRSQTAVVVWMAQGTPSGNGTVTATLKSTPKSAVIAVSRYSGVAAESPVGNVVSGNTTASGACSRGVDSAAYSVNLATTVDGARVYGAVATRQRAHTPGHGYRERAEIRRAGGGNSAGIAVEDRIVPFASSVAVNGSFSDSMDWAVVGVEIKPQ